MFSYSEGCVLSHDKSGVGMVLAEGTFELCLDICEWSGVDEEELCWCEGKKTQPNVLRFSSAGKLLGDLYLCWRELIENQHPDSIKNSECKIVYITRNPKDTLRAIKMPREILFLQYEELRRDPIVQVKRQASFLEGSFNNEGEIDEVAWRCSLERRKDLEVNKDGERVRNGG
ncbi:hypothetical protein POTOM_029082 [Populus tomentosa]|uniref:Sulfotransferase n=1 Tax=Populus tomentosa TaxID=118781 RepID=A0A8X7Z4L5_POPTO|nr:hypothetical protein POTOM_029082 [Populus tomentosa]